MAIKKTYRVIVHAEGRQEPIKGPSTVDPELVQRDLAVITDAQKRGSDSIVSLEWLTIKESHIAAAFIQEAWSGSSVP